jgi:glycosyltransferase involved in cell wall biosynthesis
VLRLSVAPRGLRDADPGGDAALYFTPERPDQIAQTIIRLLGDAKLAAELVERGRARQRLFTWSRAAEETLAVYERARSNT